MVVRRTSTEIPARHKEHGDLYWFGPPESKTLRQFGIGIMWRVICPKEGACWGILNQAFRTPNREFISVNQPQFERFSCETPGAFKFVFISQNLSFDQYPSSSAE
jgi:hypothetical protein